MERAPDVQVVDGVRVLHAPGADPERCTGTLLFRAGFADEVLASYGFTHLVEHLALHPARGRRPAYNGFVDDLVCGFTTRGTPGEVVAFLDGVCAALRELPVDRLADEIRVLEAEERSVGGLSPRMRLAAARFGARGYGLKGWKPVGLRAATPERLRRWTAERFTTQNAVAWLDAAELPAGLRFDLPAGTFRPPPEPEPLPRLEVPGRYPWRSEAVGLSGMGTLSPALRVGLWALEHRLEERLRYARGLVYEVVVVFLRYGADRVHVSVVIEVTETEQAIVRDVLLEAVAELGADGPDAEELAIAVRQLADDAREDRGNARFALDTAAEALLLGDTWRTPRAFEEAVAAVTREQVRDALADAFSEPILGERALGDEGPPAGFADIDLTETELPDAVRVWPLVHDTDADEGDVLIEGEEAIAWVPGDEERPGWAIRYDEVVLVDDHPLAGLRVTNPDDIVISICPTDHVDGEELVAALRERFGELVVPVRTYAALARLRALAADRTAPVVLGSRALVAIGDALEEDEEPLELVAMRDRDGPGLLLVTDRGYLACSSPPMEYDPVVWRHEDLGAVEALPFGELSIVTPAGPWAVTIAAGLVRLVALFAAQREP